MARSWGRTQVEGPLRLHIPPQMPLAAHGEQGTTQGAAGAPGEALPWPSVGGTVRALWKHWD